MNWRQRLGLGSIRGQLLALVLVPLALVLPALLLLLLGWLGAAFDRLLITKVQSDLAVAQGYFEQVRVGVGQSAEAVAQSHALHQVLSGSLQAGDLPGLLARARAQHRLDFLVLRDPQGRPWSEDSLGQMAPDPGAVPGRPASGAAGAQAHVAVWSQAAVAAVAPALATQVPIALLPTRNATPTSRTAEDRALVLQARAPVHDEQGRTIAWLQAGLLLNRNLAFIDHINTVVYPEGALPFGSHGTTTLFLDDVRISTNVRLFGANPGTGTGSDRAIGTRVSQQVRDAVLVHGGTWLQRAFVVDEWYLSAYQPLTDEWGERVGMLYVGFLERPFQWLKYGMLAAIGLIFGAVMLLAAAVSLRAAGRIFDPIGRMGRTMDRVEAGDASARVGPVDRDDELGQLAGHLDHLLDVQAANTRALQAWNAELDAKVAERTRELADAQAQLVQAERLATIGQLTASIAHEVNNPIAVIQGNLDLARSLMGPVACRAASAELALIDEQVERMRRIVQQMLRFARPAEGLAEAEAVDPNALVEASLQLVAHLLAQGQVTVQRELHARRGLRAHRHELQQVLVNLLVNALHAVSGAGPARLVVRTADVGPDQVCIEVIDDGPGIGDELLGQLFQPFVTRKREGTGLGLWISRGIAERHGGSLRAAQRADGQPGAVFTLSLPAAASAEQAAQPGQQA